MLSRNVITSRVTISPARTSPGFLSCAMTRTARSRSVITPTGRLSPLTMTTLPTFFSPMILATSTAGVSGETATTCSRQHFTSPIYVTSVDD